MFATALCAAEARTFEGVKVYAAGSINPPNPIEGANLAKQDAIKKAAAAGFKGAVKWERLSKDSDASLKTEGARGTGYVYIFTVRGSFSK